MVVNLNTQSATVSKSGTAATVSDGGTITHGFSVAPQSVLAVGCVAGEIITVTAISATTFTVAIKTNLNAPGTPQTIYWQAIA